MKKDIHRWFGLSYANYLVLPRSVLQSMPEDWQNRFVDLLKELEDTDWSKQMPESFSWYSVQCKDSRGKFMRDPLRDYRRGRRNVFKERV